MTRPKIIALLLGAALSAGAMAQTNTAEMTQRDANQQQRIENGLKSGQLTTREAARLEKQEARVDRMQANALKDGKLSPAERQRIDAAQNKVSQDIYKEKHDAQTGNPNSASSQRMQQTVQRDANQEQRIANGVKNGSLTNKEVGHLERGQARVDGAQARAGADGHVSAAEQARINARQNHQSAKIYNKKHNDKTRG
ncbi:hypothetical protein IP84_05415 [beta proteobacterium AAP99]|nr:hypothetical protein IP84_05415 [beta proteobacterium AAP99]